MNWQTIVLKVPDLTAGLHRIREDRGTVTSFLRCSEGFRVVCAFSDATSGAALGSND